MSRAISWARLSAKSRRTSRLVTRVAGSQKNSLRAAVCLLKLVRRRNSARSSIPESGARCSARSRATKCYRSRRSFGHDWLYATAFAAIVIVSGVMLQHFAGNRREAPQDLARAPQVGVQPTSGPTEVPSPRKKHELPGKRSAQSNNVLAFASRHGSSRHSEETRTPDELVAAQAARDSSAQIEPAMQSLSVGPVALEASSQVSRIEIQTADPNIRIIWLSPRESREPAENNHDQDPRENGNRK